MRHLPHFSPIVRGIGRPLARGFVLPLLAALLAVPAAAAEPEREDGNVCIDASRVNGWSVIDGETIRLQVGANRVYEVKLGTIANAAALRATSRIGIVPDVAGRLCSLGGRILADGFRIPVREIRPLPREGEETTAER